MSVTQHIIMIGATVMATMLTRFLPFIVFPSGRPTPCYVRYLGKYLPSAMFGLLVVYSLKDTNVFAGNHGLPEFIAVAAVAALHAEIGAFVADMSGFRRCVSDVRTSRT